MMCNLLTRLRQVFRRPVTVRQVFWDDAGFRVVQLEATVGRCAWVDVVEVYAFKFDLFGVDDICIGFRERDNQCCWVSEEDVGYQAFLDNLECRFDGIRTDWFREVALPAFETNRTTLWGEPPETPGS